MTLGSLPDKCFVIHFNALCVKFMSCEQINSHMLTFKKRNVSWHECMLSAFLVDLLLTQLCRPTFL